MTDQPTNSPRPAPPARLGTADAAAPTPAQPDGLAQGGDILNIIADVEKQLERVRDFQQTHDAQVQSLGQRREAMEATRRELEQTAAELARRDEQMRGQGEVLREREHELQDRTAALEQRVQALAEEQDAIEQSRQELTQLQAQSERRQADAAAAEQALQHKEAALVEHDQALQRRQSQLDQQVRDLAARESQVQSQARELEQERQSLARQHQALQQEAATQSQARDAAQRRAEEAAAQLADMAARLEASHVRDAETQTQRDQALARLAELQQQLQVATQRLTAAESELEQQRSTSREARQKLDLAGAKLTELAQVVSRQAAELEKLPAALAEIQDQRQQIVTLREQAARAGAPGGAPGAADASAADRAASQAQAKALEEAQQAARIFEQRVQALEQALTQAREQAAGATSGTDAAQQALRQKTAMLKTAAKHLQLRKQRLHRWRHAMRQRLDTHGAEMARAAQAQAQAAAHEDYQQRTRQMAELDRRQQELNQVQVMLAESERRMIRRWARPRAAIVLSALVGHAVVIALASWFAADQFFPARVAASVTVQASTRAGQSLGAEDLSRWQQWHAAIVSDPAFHATLAKRLDARQLDAYRDAKAITTRLQADLKVDDHVPGEVTYSLAGANAKETLLLMDVIASTVLTESARQTGKRGDGAKAGIPGERNDGGAVRYASLGPRPLVDQRLWYAGTIFVVAFVLSVSLAVLIYGRLLRSKRMFEQQNEALGPDADEAAVPIR